MASGGMDYGKEWRVEAELFGGGEFPWMKGLGVTDERRRADHEKWGIWFGEAYYRVLSGVEMKKGSS